MTARRAHRPKPTLRHHLTLSLACLASTPARSPAKSAVMGLSCRSRRTRPVAAVWGAGAKQEQETGETGGGGGAVQVQARQGRGWEAADEKRTRLCHDGLITARGAARPSRATRFARAPPSGAPAARPAPAQPSRPLPEPAPLGAPAARPRASAVPPSAPTRLDTILKSSMAGQRASSLRGGQEKAGAIRVLLAAQRSGPACSPPRARQHPTPQPGQRQVDKGRRRCTSLPARLTARWTPRPRRRSCCCTGAGGAGAAVVRGAGGERLPHQLIHRCQTTNIALGRLLAACPPPHLRVLHQLVHRGAAVHGAAHVLEGDALQGGLQV